MTSPTCTIDATTLIGYLSQPSAAPELSAHVAGCAHCQLRLLEMAAAANSGGHGRRQHADCEAELPAFVQARAAGAPENRADLPLITHLALCQDCFARYAELRAMRTNDLNDARPMPPRAAYRPPDLSFLRPTWVRVVEGNRLIQALRIHLGLLFAGPGPALAPLPVRGGEVQVAPGEPAAWRQASFGVEQLGSLDVDLRLSQTAQSRARLEVYAQAAQQLDLDFVGTRVVLRFNDGRELVRLTDAAGRAIFEDVAEAELRSAVLEITPAERPPA